VVIASFVGAVGGGLLFICRWSLLLIIVCHLFLAVILVKTAFTQETWYVLFKHTFVLYILSSLFSGVITLLCSLFKNPILYTYNGVVYADVSPILIAVLSVISYSGIRIYEYFTRRRAARNFEYRLFLDDGNGVLQCRALFDTGLHLTEPFSGKAVIIVEKETLRPFLSKKTMEVLDMTSVAGLSFRLIPYRSVVGEGVLPAFLPKRLFLCLMKLN
jgi:stage II sporulation protein GA (sporulation sigma-E factor processing peptidase)